MVRSDAGRWQASFDSRNSREHFSKQNRTTLVSIRDPTTSHSCGFRERHFTAGIRREGTLPGLRLCGSRSPNSGLCTSGASSDQSAVRRFPDPDLNKPASREGAIRDLLFVGALCSSAIQKMSAAQVPPQPNAPRKELVYSVPIKQSSCQTHYRLRSSRVIGSANDFSVLWFHFQQFARS